jgi:hypothetical protein
MGDLMNDSPTHELDAVRVQAANDARVALGSLWVKQPLLLIMIRHFG